VRNAGYTPSCNKALAGYVGAYKTGAEARERLLRLLQLPAPSEAEVAAFVETPDEAALNGERVPDDDRVLDAFARALAPYRVSAQCEEPHAPAPPAGRAEPAEATAWERAIADAMGAAAGAAWLRAPPALCRECRAALARPTQDGGVTAGWRTVYRFPAIPRGVLTDMEDDHCPHGRGAEFWIVTSSAERADVLDEMRPG
jgi:hypothetical protein